ncbi:D-alanyl-D-alanine carboxypeptidase family protein [Bhargavaea cecembensis]|uniref:D-alanyl-D-alanine carboxypeptidase family protein n=1 Tax=Bhargavaea cecembensis TaxID=394098 RepID=UPI0006939489|nr:serine hydrolase [Bhargavaea cecembensis]
MRKALLTGFMLVALVLSMPAATASAARAYAVIDADSGRLLEGSREQEPLPIASLTKIWTALTFLDAEGMEGEVPVTRRAAEAEGSSIYVEAGEEVPAKDLLYGLMLRSGNDAATALAEYAGGSVEGFVGMMNEKAEIAGLKKTEFTNPSGLHEDRHLSTAYETALMLKYAMDNRTFREIASTSHYRYGENGVWENKHRLVRAEGTAVAGKTGFTKRAGRTLATQFEKEGKSVIVVTLDDGDDWNTHRTLSERAFRKYEQVTAARPGTYALLPGLRGELGEPINVLVSEEEQERLSHAAVVPRNGKDGIWQVRLDGKVIATGKLKIKRK